MKEANWSEEEMKKMQELYPFVSNEQISLILGRSINSIQHKANRMGLKKDREANKAVRSRARSGSRGANWHGGRKKNKKGHVLVMRKGHPMADSAGYVMEHRLIMAEYLGRPLEKNEVVHHLNGVKDDNRIENLKLMTNSEHSSLHHKGAKREGEALKNIRKGIKKRDEQSMVNR